MILVPFEIAYATSYYSVILTFSPGISPGAAAPLELLPEISTLSNVPASAASGFSFDPIFLHRF